MWNHSGAAARPPPGEKTTVVLGEDYLGGCSHHSLADFKAGGYFRDMVAEAIGEARAHAGRLASVKLRAA